MKFVWTLVFLSGLMMFWTNVHAQSRQPVRRFDRSDFSVEDSARLSQEYGKNKELLPQFTLQTLIALSYFPELKNTHIRFILIHTHSPLCTRPVFPSLLLKGSSRTFTITISDSTEWKLQPITLGRLNFNAQVGVLGHELSHVSDFSRRSLLNLTGSGIGHISSKYIDKFEYRTDSICIAHGLGYQLLGWSQSVREALHTVNYDGADNINKSMDHERYMNPDTILRRIAGNPIYAGVYGKL